MIGAPSVIGAFSCTILATFVSIVSPSYVSTLFKLYVFFTIAVYDEMSISLSIETYK